LNNYSLANQNIADTCWLLIQKSLEDYFFLSRSNGLM